ncbi:MAG: hypothetical protein FD132_661 [bacterium]|nr:MAG: hypothetical protein FD132_661 [bacterium]
MPGTVREVSATLVASTMRRPAGEQRQDFRVRRMVLAQRFLGLADLPLAGQEHQDVAGAFAGEFVDGVQQGFRAPFPLRGKGWG